MFDAIQVVRSAVNALVEGCEPDSLSPASAVEAVRQLGAIRASLDAVVARVAQRVEASQAQRRDDAHDSARSLGRALGSTLAEARRTAALGRQLEELPATRQAVEAGKISAAQAGLIASAAAVNPAAEADLLLMAGDGIAPLREACARARAEVEDDTARAARQHAARSLRIWSDEEGMVCGRFEFPPEIGGHVKAVLDRAVHRIVRARRECEPEPLCAYGADALAEFVLEHATQAQGAPRVTRSKTTMHVVVDHAALLRGRAEPGERCEIPGVGPVSARWAQHLLGDAFLTLVVRKGVDITTVAHLGRKYPAELLSAMIVAGRECAITGCGARGYLELDHSEVDVAAGGPTAWWNLDWLCAVDHRRKTAGWRLGPRDPATGKRTLTPPLRGP